MLNCPVEIANTLMGNVGIRFEFLLHLIWGSCARLKIGGTNVEFMNSTHLGSTGH